MDTDKPFHVASYCRRRLWMEAFAIVLIAMPITAAMRSCLLSRCNAYCSLLLFTDEDNAKFFASKSPRLQT
jgi:hypothetical protein